MKPNSPISRLFSLFLTGLMLLLAAGGQSWVGASPAPKHTTETKQKPTKSAKSDHRAVIKASTLEAVVTPASAFNFGQTVFLLPPPSILIISIEQPALPRLADIPHYFFSYFCHVFGNHIAANAP